MLNNLLKKGKVGKSFLRKFGNFDFLVKLGWQELSRQREQMNEKQFFLMMNNLDNRFKFLR
jgi:hypothetical protein